MRAWKCSSTRAFPAGTLIASAFPAAVLNSKRHRRERNGHNRPSAGLFGVLCSLGMAAQFLTETDALAALLLTQLLLLLSLPE
jgi:hypothetical protein